MNGRVYDYNLGRFMSVDPVIQFVANSRGINPYSYIMNNPMAGTDPTGYIIETIWDVANVIYDVGKIAYGAATGDQEMVEEGLIDLAVDAAATLVPFVPAGSTKAVREGAESIADGRQASNKSDANPETPRSQQADNTPQSGNGADTRQQSRNNSGKQETQDTKGQDQVNDQSSGPCSFVLGTIVAMDGSLEAIEDINVGDLVVSRDDETWEDGTQPVNATFGEHHESVLQITYVIESDWFQFNKQVMTTAEHPFMVASVGWAPAAEMYVGDRIVTLDNEFARIVAIEEKSEPQYAYNFEVDEFHTYAVTEDYFGCIILVIER